MGAKEIKKEDLLYPQTEGDWNDYLEGLMASALELTPEEFREWRKTEKSVEDIQAEREEGKKSN